MKHSELITELDRLFEVYPQMPEMRSVNDGLIEGFDFASLDEAQLKYFKMLTWHRFTFKDCENITGKWFENCEFTDCTFASNESEISFKHCLAFFNSDNVRDHFKLVRDTSVSIGNLLVDHNDRRLIVAAVVDPDSGFYEDIPVMIRHLRSRGVSVVRLYCDKKNNPFHANDTRPSHPIFSNLTLIDGLYLPGGDDVITDPKNYTQREKMEKFLVDYSLEKEVPLLGVCRGHQFVSHYFGAEVRDTYDNDDEDIHSAGNVIRITASDSRLFAVAEKKYKTQVEKGLSSSLSLVGDVFSYKSRCAHNQAAFFKSAMDPRVKVTSRAGDDVIEGLEINGHIVTYQHHHELRLRSQKDRFSRAVLKDFAKMIESYHANKSKIGLVEIGPISLTKRKKKIKRIKKRRSNLRTIRVVEVKEESGEISLKKSSV